jgi:hypothetical protein
MLPKINCTFYLGTNMAPLTLLNSLILCSLMMCSDPADLRQRAEWDGASGTSRRELLTVLHR